MPGEADRVAQPARVNRALRAVGAGAQYSRVFLARFVPGVATAADRNVEHSVGTETERAVRVLAAVGQTFDQQLRRSDRAVASQFGAVEFRVSANVKLVVIGGGAVSAPEVRQDRPR